MNKLYYKLNNGFYNLYAVIGGQRIALKLVNKYDFRLLKVFIDSGIIEELPAVESKKGEEE